MRARTEGLGASDVDSRLTDERSLLIAWLNRGTLHLVRAEDYPWLHAVTTPSLLNESLRRLAVEGVSADAAEKGLAAIERVLGVEGPQPGPELRRRLEAEGHPVAGQAFFHLCFRAGVLGLVVRGPMVGKQHAYALARDWLGKVAAVDREAALAELARRYLAGHAPASERDLARWAGVPLREARAGLASIAAEMEECGDGLLRLRCRERESAGLPPPRLLGAFDPVLLGWTSREEITGRHTELITVNGLFRPFAMVKGRAVATWRLVKGRVAIEPLATIAKKDRAALDADAADVERFLGD